MTDKIFKFGNLKDSKGAKCDIHNKRCGYVKGVKTRYCNLPQIFHEKSFYDEVFKGKDGVPDWETFKERSNKKESKCCRPLYELASFWKEDPALLEFNIKKEDDNNFCHFHDGYCSNKKHNNIPEVLKANFDNFYDFTFSKSDDVQDKGDIKKRIDEKKTVFCPSGYKAYKKWIFSHPELKKPIKRKLEKDDKKEEKKESSNKKTKTKK